MWMHGLVILAAVTAGSSAARADDSGGYADLELVSCRFDDGGESSLALEIANHAAGPFTGTVHFRFGTNGKMTKADLDRWEQLRLKNDDSRFAYPSETGATTADTETVTIPPGAAVRVVAKGVNRVKAPGADFGRQWVDPAKCAYNLFAAVGTSISWNSPEPESRDCTDARVEDTKHPSLRVKKCEVAEAPAQ